MPANPKTRRGGTKGSSKPEAKARITARTANVGVRGKREAIAKSFGKIEIDSDQVNFLYTRRHLTIVRDPVLGGLGLKYVIEFDELEQVIWKTLQRIRKRDGMKIFKEVAGRLLDGLALSIETHDARDHRDQRTRRGDRGSHWLSPSPSARSDPP
jgi:hypothetical protein